MKKRTEWPFLQRLLIDKQHDHHSIQQQVNDGDFRGMPDEGKRRWLLVIREEIEELVDALRVLTGDDRRILFGGYPLVLTVAAIALLTVLQIALLVWVSGR